MARFFGWIPNVAGRLSFTLSGTSAYPNQFFHSTNVGSGGRYFAGFQYRNLSDTTIPFLSDWPSVRGLIDNWIYNKDGRFVFLCLLKVSEDRSRAKGQIFVFEQQRWSGVNGEFADWLHGVSTLWSDDVVLHQTLPPATLASAGYSARFEIDRSGVTEIDTLQAASDPRHDRGADRLEHAFAAQSYFCLRDLLHTHRFHSPSSDTIIDVYDDLESLKEQVNFGLMRRALSARRVQTVEAQQRSLGIISYLRSFRENVMTSEERERLTFSLDATVASIQAGLPLIAAKEYRSKKNQLDRFRQKAIAGIAILFGYAALIRDSTVLVPETMSWIRTLFVLVQEQVGLALMGLVFTVLFLQVLLSLKQQERDHVVRTTSRLALAFKVRKFAVFEIAAAVVALALALALIGWIFHTVLTGPRQTTTGKPQTFAARTNFGDA